MPAQLIGFARHFRFGRPILGLALTCLSACVAAPEGGTPKDAVLANETLASAMAEQRIVNAHEHIQSLDEAEKLRAAMAETGIGKTALMGSSWFTITLNPKVGFTRIDRNNRELMGIHRAYPRAFEAWPAVDPRDPRSLMKIQDLVAQGARGVKLYLGHGFVSPVTDDYLFHFMAMDDPRVLPLYAWCEANFIPVIYHVNPYRPGFAEEFIAVLSAYPDLKVVAPHFILSSIRSTRLREFLDSFPNLYSDISFGHDEFLIAGLKRISKDPEKFKRLFEDYPDRFLFGSDLVVTELAAKDSDWIGERILAYFAMLAMESYQVSFIPGERLNGLGLSGELLTGILYGNYENLMASRPRETTINRAIDWTRMGVPKTGRAPGMASPRRPPTSP